jgi:hypothetical protein
MDGNADKDRHSRLVASVALDACVGINKLVLYSLDPLTFLLVAQSASMKKRQPAFQMHRNFECGMEHVVCFVAEFAGH